MKKNQISKIEIKYFFIHRNVEIKSLNDFPVNEKNSRTETMIQLLKSKIKSQENEIQAIQTEYKKKVLKRVVGTKYLFYFSIYFSHL